MKKRIFAILCLLLTLFLSFSMLSCGSDTEDNGSSDGELGGSTDVVTDTANRKIVYTVNLEIETKNVDSVCKTLTEKASALGGYIESSDQYYEDGKSSRCDIVYRIPTEKLDEFLATAEKSGTVSDKSVITDDITKKYVNSQAQKQALVERKTQLEALLAENVSVSDKVDIIEQISSVNTQIMEIDRRLSGYDSDLAYSTVTVEIREEFTVADIIVPIVIIAAIAVIAGGTAAAVIVINGKRAKNKKVEF